jgi:arylsulfatase A-like enzyme
MRDFHSRLRDTPFLDRLRRESVFVPNGRGQGHHQGDSLNAELTGIWTARQSDSELGEHGFEPAWSHRLPPTVIEVLEGAGYDVVTRIAWDERDLVLGTHAVGGGMRERWLRDEPERLAQFTAPRPMDLDEWLAEVRRPRSRRFYAHVFLRQTHRPWGDVQGLFSLVGETPPADGWGWPHDASCARRAALEQPDAFAALRRRGLAAADRTLERIFEATRHLPDVTYLVYSNHGEVFDHFRYHLPYARDEDGMVAGTSHGPYPYEVLYANMQMWLIPGHAPRVVQGLGRSIDIAPTILDLAGVRRPRFDGESTLRYFASGRLPDRERYAETHYGGAASMVRADGWKLVATGASEHHRLAVFDLRSDPGEQVDLIDTPEGQDVLRWAIDRHRELKEAPQERAGPLRRVRERLRRGAAST